jgi:hypothetical protein
MYSRVYLNLYLIIGNPDNLALQEDNPKTEVFPLARKNFSEIGRSQGHVQKRPPRVSVHQPLCYLLTSCLLLQLPEL